MTNEEIRLTNDFIQMSEDIAGFGVRFDDLKELVGELRDSEKIQEKTLEQILGDVAHLSSKADSQDARIRLLEEGMIHLIELYRGLARSRGEK